MGIFRTAAEKKSLDPKNKDLRIAPDFFIPGFGRRGDPPRFRSPLSFAAATAPPQAGLLTAGSIYSPRLPISARQWLRAGFVPGHSGGTVTALPSSLFKPRQVARESVGGKAPETRGSGGTGKCFATTQVRQCPGGRFGKPAGGTWLISV
jgi:hypothetical protein